MSCPVYDRYALPAGARFPGPAIVEEPESTVYLGSQAKAVVTRSGDLRVTLTTDARRVASKSVSKGSREETEAI